MTEKQIREYIENHTFIGIKQFGEEAERTIRKVISKMRKEGKILIALNDAPNVRQKIEHCTDEQIEAYAKVQAASMGTQYFNTLKPIKKYIKNQQLLELMGSFELIFEGPNGQLMIDFEKAEAVIGEHHD